MPPRRRAEPVPRTRGGRGGDGRRSEGARGGTIDGGGGAPARRRRLLGLLVVLVVLAVGAAIALPILDSAARERVADRIADQVQAELGLRSPPLVEIGGTWFLLQALRGRYDGAMVRSAVVPYEGLELGATRVRLRDVRVPPAVLLGRAGTVTVAGGDARTTVPWTVLEQQAGESVGSEVAMARGQEPGTIDAETDLAGIPVAVTVRPRLGEDAIVLRPAAVAIAGRELSLDEARDLAARFGLGDAGDSLLDGFTYGLDVEDEQRTVRSVAVGRDGLVVGGSIAPFEVPVGG